MPMKTIQAPESLEEAWFCKDNAPDDSLWLSGTTWLRTQWEAGQLNDAKQWIRLDRIPELNQGIHLAEEELRISSMTTFAELEEDERIREKAPIFSKAIKQIAAPSIREQATIGGNIATGIGDSLPALIALDARISYDDHLKRRELLLTDWLQEGCPGLIVELILPKTEENLSLTFYEKTGRREAFIPSAVTVAISGRLNKKSGTFSHIRAAAAGGTMEPVRLKQLEQSLMAVPLVEGKHYRLLQEQILKDYSPPEDPFLSKSYKQRVASNLIIQNIHSYIEGDHYAAE
ncbi:FAD binding domain-containing protein [Salisediminibacterium beveridgei]|uniref:Xanthine dehydrogenase, FAD binding subunit n=1 Tax=Salisediminibacterium beveridgei TaxID=632773 RepID=A0A1D7QYE9_9BACI|nr:FAD binding domain-containing protein [Salisediminibacterium beveridgei]AOM84034.1 Xanthine dehydrogenase, FAD binding subunit [Salisediminibacterium beveridgei]